MNELENKVYEYPVMSELLELITLENKTIQAKNRLSKLIQTYNNKRKEFEEKYGSSTLQATDLLSEIICSNIREELKENGRENNERPC